MSGFYYSEPYTLATGIPGQPPTDFRRTLIYIDSYYRVYIFQSTKSVKKLYEKFMKDPNQLTEEYGSIELTTYGDIYINSKSKNSEFGSYKYVGELITQDQFYLEYKSSIDKKVSLNVYFHKY